MFTTALPSLAFPSFSPIQFAPHRGFGGVLERTRRQAGHEAWRVRSRGSSEVEGGVAQSAHDAGSWREATAHEVRARKGACLESD